MPEILPLYSKYSYKQPPTGTLLAVEHGNQDSFLSATWVEGMSVIKPFSEGYSGMPSQANNGKQRYMGNSCNFLRNINDIKKIKYKLSILKCITSLTFSQPHTFRQEGRNAILAKKKNHQNWLGMMCFWHSKILNTFQNRGKNYFETFQRGTHGEYS